MSDDYKVDLRPLEHPVNPFGYAATQIRRRHPTLAGDDLQAVEWLEYLAETSPELKTRNAALVLLVAESANFIETRQVLAASLDVIEKAIAAASAA